MAQRWIATDFGDLDVLRFEEYDPPAPAPGEVTIAVRAAGVNPADYKHIRGSRAPGAAEPPLPIGYEIAGVVSAVGGPDAAGAPTRIGSGEVAVGDEVLAFRVAGGYATELTVPAPDVFRKPDDLPFPEAANLLLAGATAAEMLHVTRVREGDTILVHGASGAVGVSVLQQARRLGARTIGTSSRASFDTVERFGGTPVAYGEGLGERVRAAAPDGIAAALDCVGTDEAIDVSLGLVADRSRLVTIVAGTRAKEAGFVIIGGAMPASKAYRDEVRAELVRLAGAGELVVPMARTFPLAEAVAALELVRTGHPGGKVALIP
ncbi:NADP-dependent oxidoreductase [Microbacterium sp. BK668]|uniref:quinone oxidoreductase family protein n=1 Tax=Microbacterium sp. BK668 TaxID=2512118 RepID=UPI00105E4AA5|nr:NADP-dependent oxidoreductase [Microbacterium sp. BK668]TDN88612.1 NADPH:quinone reductase-like Zn-dependent oxidoreductase [Microbacterium sp. BK668]